MKTLEEEKEFENSNVQDKKNGKVYVLDTNIILDDIDNIVKLSDQGKNIIVIPETVLIELESKKKDFGELGYQAREFSRLISHSVEENKVKRKINSVENKQGDLTDEVLSELIELKKNLSPNLLKDFDKKMKDYMKILSNFVEEKKLQIKDEKTNVLSIVKYLYTPKNFETEEAFKVKIHIIAKEKYESDFNLSYVKESNDKRIVEIADNARNYYVGKKITFVSLDVYARIFAKLSNVSTETLKDNDKKPKDLELYKIMNIEDEKIFENLNHENIFKINKDHKRENFSYEFIFGELKKFAIIINENISILEESKDFKGVAVQPKNIKQKLFMKSLLSNMYDVHVIDARAGSGKTLISLVSAMKLIEDHNNSYNKIIYVRNSIESVQKGEEVGFLSGNEEKFRIYNMALYDNLEFIARKQLDKKTEKKKKEIQENPLAAVPDLKNKFSGKGKVEEKEENLNIEVDKLILELKRKYNIETLWPGEARGRTLSNAIVIVDEWQNASNKTTQLILSRLDDTCKAIVIGSTKQIDNMYLSKYNNGLTSMFNLSITNNMLTFFGITMETSVRGKFAYFADEVF